MAETMPTVIVIDDDCAIRESIGSLVRSVGLQTRLLASVDEFLKGGRPEGPACLVLDVRLPGKSGLDFQRELAAAKLHLPIIFITGYGDIPMSVRAMKGGAIEFLTKPFRDRICSTRSNSALPATATGWPPNKPSLHCGRASRPSLRANAR